ncbi:MAG: GGDEF domain-containing protein [Actinomycetota bacterium]|nr:GGDEF domain-containing protein [Actinomycetota bacterium]
MIGEPADELAAVHHAFVLVHDLQANEPGAMGALEALGDLAVARGWSEALRAVRFGRAIAAWLQGSDGVLEAVEALIEDSRHHGDDVMLALGLALRSDHGFSGYDRIGVVGREADLARAAVILEHANGGAVQKITAHTACGIAFGNRWLFELADEQYAAALAIGDGEPAGSYDFVLSPILFNRAETQVSWASMLRQLGDHEGIAACRRTWQAASHLARVTYQMVPSWQAELDALGCVVDAIAGEDVTERVDGQFARLEHGEAATARLAGLLWLARALSDLDAGRPAAASVEAALATLDQTGMPHVYSLALCLAAEIEATDGRQAGLRYGRRHLEEHWADRRAALGAMQSRIQAERLDQERAALSRHIRLDDLTGIGNRRALEHHLGELARHDVARVGMIVADLDAFKVVNDRHGHLAGDGVLVRTARVLESVTGPRDLAVRLGGDEFVLLLADVDLEAAAERARELLVRFDAEDFAAVAPGTPVGLSAGVAAGRRGELQEVLAAADAALYRAKAGEGERIGGCRFARPRPDGLPLRPGAGDALFTH